MDDRFRYIFACMQMLHSSFFSFFFLWYRWIIWYAPPPTTDKRNKKKNKINKHKNIARVINFNYHFVVFIFAFFHAALIKMNEKKRNEWKKVKITITFTMHRHGPTRIETSYRKESTLCAYAQWWTLNNGKMLSDSKNMWRSRRIHPFSLFKSTTGD